MKTLLLGLTVVTCIVVAESAPFDAPILKLIKELDELRLTANNFLEHQEQNPNTTATAITTDTAATASPSTAGETTASPTTPVVCGGLLAGPSGEIRSPNAPNPYPNNVQCVWTIEVPSGQFIRITITITLADPGDSFRILQGNTTVFSTTGRRKRSLNDEPSYEHVYREDEGDYYYDGDNKDYYFYDGRRKKEQYFYHRRQKRAVFTLDIAGNGQPVNIIFTSDASGSASGVISQFSVQGNGGGGGSSSESGGSGGSSDEEE